MTATLHVIETTRANDIPGSLRAIADGIEAGEYGDAHNLVWAIDCGSSRIDVGLCGFAPEPGATAHLLLALAQRKIEGGCL